MKAQDLKSKQIQKSISMIIGMAFLLLGINSVQAYIKYPALIISISAFLFIMYGYIKHITTQLSSVKKFKNNN